MAGRVARQRHDNGPVNESSLQSVHTSNLPDILGQLGVSLVVTTYQSGKVILVRRDQVGSDPPTVNTHFREFDRPMGACAKDQRLSIGGAHTVWEFRNVPAAAAKVEPEDKHDACYLPRGVHFTGNIDIHEMNWSASDELWLVNTRFSCLCTIDREHSFNPRWWPPFVTALAPEDRCHLNGLAMRDGEPRYVTALGETDTRGGWRANKVSGGLLMDVQSGEILLRGLSMPHSPRWYAGKLWVLESGKGSLACLDADTGELRSVASLPGFTRGIDFVGPIAFIGLSKVRESAVFSGLPITRDWAERECGVWVVNIETGETLGFLRFDDGVEEIFAVQALHAVRFPELLPADSPLTNETYVVPDEILKHVALATPKDVEASPDGIMARALEDHRQKRFDRAAAGFRECLALQADFPNARLGLGVALAELGEWNHALEQLQTAVEREPDRADIQISLGSLYQRMREFGQARTAFETAVRRQPKDAGAHVALAAFLLQHGHYREGFAEYEWRLKGAGAPTFRSPHPDWDGQAAPGKKLLVYIEHDDPRRLVVLLRFIGIASEKVGQVFVMSTEPFAPLLSAVTGVADVRSQGAFAAADYDMKASLDSLPFLLGVESAPQLPHAGLDAAALARRSGGAASSGSPGRRRIGIVCAHSAAAAQAIGVEQRTALFRTLNALVMAKADGIDLTSPDARAAGGNAAALEAPPPLPDSGDLVALACAIADLDLVIGVDSAPIHLAAALGKPTWVLLDPVPEWYWPAESDTSDWYPDIRIFRQPRPRDSAELTGELCAAFDRWLAAPAAR